MTITSEEIDNIIEHYNRTTDITPNNVDKLIQYIGQCRRKIYDQDVHIHTLEFY